MNTSTSLLHRAGLVALSACLAFTLTSSAFAQGAGPGGPAYGPRPGSGSGPGPGLNTPPVLPLPEDQAKTLQFMREEEKLARDVYQFLFDKWQLNIFKNIAAAEESHFVAVGGMLTRYNVSDPAADKPAGVYSNADLNTLYAQLTAKGATSVADAFEVGILIEKADIADLEKAIAATDRVDIKRLYTNLMNASYNHQEAFEANHEICLIAQ